MSVKYERCIYTINFYNKNFKNNFSIKVLDEKISKEHKVSDYIKAVDSFKNLFKECLKNNCFANLEIGNNLYTIPYKVISNSIIFHEIKFI